MTVPAHPRPSARHRRLADTLWGLRTDQGLTRKEVAERTGVHTSTLYRIEAARVRPQLRTLNTLFILYHVPEHDRRALSLLLSESGRTEWLHAYTDMLSEPSHAAIELEDEAHTLHAYSTVRVPDLLQTPAYTRAAILSAPQAEDHHAAEPQIQLQIRRRAALTHPTRPLRLRAICDEAVLHRLVGGPDVMHEQLQYLTEMAELPNLTVQLIPFRTGAYPNTPGSFTVMHFPDGAGAVHVEDATGDRVLTTAADLRRYADLFTHLQQAALPPAASIARIAVQAGRISTLNETRPHDHRPTPT